MNKTTLNSQKDKHSMLSLRRATVILRSSTGSAAFLSTLSLRRATFFYFMPSNGTLHFYPRSPCGERLCFVVFCFGAKAISIHALLAESDTPARMSSRLPEISIHALLAESDVDGMIDRAAYDISIHALLAESDDAADAKAAVEAEFLSTLSLRRATCTSSSWAFKLANFYPRSPCGERPTNTPTRTQTLTFLSTLSLRRATILGNVVVGLRMSFLSTLSLRRATYYIKAIATVTEFLSTLSLRRATPWDQYRHQQQHISIHALLAESDSQGAAVGY